MPGNTISLATVPKSGVQVPQRWEKMCSGTQGALKQMARVPANDAVPRSNTGARNKWWGGGHTRFPRGRATKNAQSRARYQTLQPQQCIREQTLPVKKHSAFYTQIPCGAIINKLRARNARGLVPVCASYGFPRFHGLRIHPKRGHLCYKHEATQGAGWNVDGFMPTHTCILLIGQ